MRKTRIGRREALLAPLIPLIGAGPASTQSTAKARAASGGRPRGEPCPALAGPKATLT